MEEAQILPVNLELWVVFLKLPILFFILTKLLNWTFFFNKKQAVQSVCLPCSLKEQKKLTNCQLYLLKRHPYGEQGNHLHDVELQKPPDKLLNFCEDVGETSGQNQQSVHDQTPLTGHQLHWKTEGETKNRGRLVISVWKRQVTTESTWIVCGVTGYLLLWAWRATFVFRIFIIIKQLLLFCIRVWHLSQWNVPLPEKLENIRRRKRPRSRPMENLCGWWVCVLFNIL